MKNKFNTDYYDCMENSPIVPNRANLAIFIPTKDRPLQCDFLLNSIFTNLFINESCDIYLMIKSSSEHIEKCYEEVVKFYKEKYAAQIFVCRETDFSTSFLNCLEHFNAQYKYVLGLTDDSVVFRPYDFSFQRMFGPMQYSADIFTISLRLGKNTTQQNPDDPNSKILIPAIFANGEAAWSWRGGSGDLNVYYPISLDGHIYRSSELYRLSQKINFKNLREWEGELIHYVRKVDDTVPNYMVCFESSYVVNISCNLTQYPFIEKMGPYGKSLVELQQLFDSGHRVNLDSTFNRVNIQGSHQYIELKFKKNI